VIAVLVVAAVVIAFLVVWARRQDGDSPPPLCDVGLGVSVVLHWRIAKRTGNEWQQRSLRAPLKAAGTLSAALPRKDEPAHGPRNRVVARPDHGKHAWA